MTDQVDYSTPASEIMAREPVFVEPAASVRDAARLMWERDVGLLVVGRAEDAAGVISERDVSAAVAQGQDLDGVTVEEVMSGSVVSVEPAERAFQLALEMLELGSRHLAVEQDEQVVGVVSLRDLIRPLVAGALASDADGSR